MSIDLHIHSHFSDGTMTPTELVGLACRKGLRAIALTDHDTLEGFGEMEKAGEATGLEVMAGVELSVSFEQHQLHLLGYGFDCDDTGLKKCLALLQQGRVVRNQRILEKLHKLGIDLSPDELKTIAGQGQCGRPHIAMLLRRGKVIHSMEEAFATYLGRGGTAYCSRFSYQLPEAIAIIHKAGGLAVLAHPLHTFGEPAKLAAVLPLFRDLGLDGIEAYYPTHSRRHRRDLMTIAAQFGCLTTGGSDFHGTLRPQTTLAGGKNLSVPDEVLQEMKQRLAKRRQTA
jgi:3',5'-nucleoside bisphosphate phosphatase